MMEHIYPKELAIRLLSEALAIADAALPEIPPDKRPLWENLIACISEARDATVLCNLEKATRYCLSAVQTIGLFAGAYPELAKRIRITEIYDKLESWTILLSPAWL